MNNQDSNKIINNIRTNVSKRIWNESNKKCMICGKEVKSFCKSHSIPYNVFNNMNLNNGRIIPSSNAAMKNILSNIYKGKKNSSIFRLICRECDQGFFSKLDLFDVINEDWNNELLKLQAQRILLYNIYRVKEFVYEQNEYYTEYLDERHVVCNELDMHEKLDYYINLYKETLNNNYSFSIVFDKVLDYETDFTMACLVHTIYNPFLDCIFKETKNKELKIISNQFENESFINIFNLPKNQNNLLFIVVFPYKGRTRVTVFCNSDNICGEIIKEDIKTISISNSLLYISSTIVILGRNIYGNDRFLIRFRKACEIFRKQFINGIIDMNVLYQNTLDIKEQYIYMYDNNINLFNK